VSKGYNVSVGHHHNMSGDYNISVEYNKSSVHNVTSPKHNVSSPHQDEYKALAGVAPPSVAGVVVGEEDEIEKRENKYPTPELEIVHNGFTAPGSCIMPVPRLASCADQFPSNTECRLQGMPCSRNSPKHPESSQ